VLCHLTWNGDRCIPVLLMQARTEGEELTLEMLSGCSELTIVIQLPSAEELVFKHLISEPAPESD
jgi:hypothetical protein